jgi:hypothetical protein
MKGELIESTVAQKLSPAVAKLIKELGVTNVNYHEDAYEFEYLGCQVRITVKSKKKVVQDVGRMLEDDLTPHP